MAVQEKKLSRSNQAIIYQESDGKPMADNTLQALWIVMLYDNLRGLFHGQEVFIAADLFWYPIEGDPLTKVAPDVLVVFGRPDVYRGSYKQWEESNIAPQVVFEVLSPSNTAMEMLDKLDFYERNGVEEFILLDPEKHEFIAYESQKGKLIRANQLPDTWQSPRLGIQFQIAEGKLLALDPTGVPLKTFAELKTEKDELKAQNISLSTEKDEALEEVERLKAQLRELGGSID